MNRQPTAGHRYSTVREVFQSEVTGEEIRPDEMVKEYEIAPNEFDAIDPQNPIYFERPMQIHPRSQYVRRRPL